MKLFPRENADSVKESKLENERERERRERERERGKQPYEAE
jgi:hypothetical protein